MIISKGTYDQMTAEEKEGYRDSLERNLLALREYKLSADALVRALEAVVWERHLKEEHEANVCDTENDLRWQCERMERKYPCYLVGATPGTPADVFEGVHIVKYGGGEQDAGV